MIGKATEELSAGREVTITGLDKRSVQGPVEDINVGARTVSVDGNLEHGVTGTHTAMSNGDMCLASGAKLLATVAGAAIEILGDKISISAGGSTIVIDGSGVSVNGAEIKLNC